MNWSLLVLCLAAFAMVAVVVSAATGAALPWLDRLSLLVAPRHRVHIWLGLAALPGAIATWAVIVSFLPAVGWGHDHCLAHGSHHPHLCPHHVGGAPGVVLVAVAAAVAFRVVHVIGAFVRAIRLSNATSRSLVEVSDRWDDVFVFPSAEPQAFVLGALRPCIHASRGLLALGHDVVESVLAHERVHASRRDLLWRVLCPVLAAGHLPSMSAAIKARMATAQEMAADIEAAETLPDGRARIAEALVMLAKRARTPGPGLSFTHGDLAVRVRTLLAPRSTNAVWPLRLLAGGCLAVTIAVGLAHDLVHHGLETLLGLLS